VTSTELDVASLSDHVGVVARNWFVAVTALILGAGTALVLSLSQPTLYLAETVLAVSIPVSLQESMPLDRTEMTTQAKVVASDPVARRVIDELGLESSQRALLDNTEAEAETDSRVVRVSALQPTASGAAQVVNSFAQQYLQLRAESENEKQQLRIDVHTQQLADLAGEIELLRTLLTALRGQEAAETLRSVAVLESLQEQLAASMPVADTSSSSGGGEILRMATPPEAPTQPLPYRDSLLGAFVGLVLGILLCYPVDNRRRRRQRRRRLGGRAAGTRSSALTGTPGSGH